MPSQLKLLLFGILPLHLRRAIMVRRYRREVNDWGEAELAHLGGLVAPGELALDVGSNLGCYSYELSRLTGKVIAFEPNPVLAGFVRSLRLPGVEVRQVALSSADGTAELLIPTAAAGHGLASLREEVVANRELTRVAVVTRQLDSECLPSVSFIKIDVEGYEEAVLAGAARTLERDRPKLLIEIEERHNPGGLDRIRERLGDLGYSGRFLRDGLWHPIEEFEAASHQKVDDDVEKVGKSIDRRDFDYVNNFLFLPSHGSRPVERQ